MENEKITSLASSTKVQEPVHEQLAPGIVEHQIDPRQLRESRLVAFGDRITYTFAIGREVASIHFDRLRGEIFYKGHNIRNMKLSDWQVKMLSQFQEVLRQHETGQRFADFYENALAKVLKERS